MAVAITCTGCGRTVKVQNELIGRKVKCPKCGSTFQADGQGAGARKVAPRVHVSKRLIVVGIIAIVIPTVLFLYKVGPGRVADQWAAQQPQAVDEIKDVVERVLFSHFMKSGALSMRMKSGPLKPQALDVAFFLSPMYMTMPEQIGFVGTTSQGPFKGIYHPKTREIEVDVEVGGLALGGTGTLKRGNQTLHATGRTKDGRVTVEMDGKPVEPP